MSKRIHVLRLVCLGFVCLGLCPLLLPVSTAKAGYAKPGHQQVEKQSHPAAEAQAETKPGNPPVVVSRAGRRPGRSDSALDVAAELIAAGKYANAISILEDILKRNPANADAYSFMGFANMQLGDLATAEKDLRMALKIDKRHLGANQHLGEVFAKKGQVARALDQLTVLKMLCRVSCPEMNLLQAAINEAGQKK